MAKDTFYFSHDYNARNDSKIKKLIQKHGILGYGIFWAIIEDLYNNANALRTDYDGIAYDLRVDVEIIKSVINDFELFVFSGEEFGSKSIETRIEERDKKSAKARESAYKRWSKDANALPTQSDRNAIKDSIVKNSIVKEKKIIEEVCDFFNVNEIQYPKVYFSIVDFIECLEFTKRLDHFKLQFEAYCELKKEKGFKHKIKNFMGNSDDHYETGAWVSENWISQLPEKPKPFSEIGKNQNDKYLNMKI